MQKNTQENCLIQVIKELKDCLFLLMIKAGDNQVTANSFNKYFLPRIKIENYNMKLMEEIFMINQLMTQWSNTTKSEKYQQDKVMIKWLVVCWILLILKKNCRLIAADLSKQKALDSDSRAIQQIIFTGKIKSTVANTRIIIYYILEQSKETILKFSKGTTKVL